MHSRETGRFFCLSVGAFLSMLLFAMPGSAGESDSPRTIAGIDDPLEGLNRWTTGLNDFVRILIVDPLIDFYQGITPEPIRKAVSNAARNLAEPATAASSLLQGDTGNAIAATQRFLINSTAGLGGLQDRAKELGIESRAEDLGQALGKHGFGAGPHIVLPLLGPSNLRDAAGDIATAVASPLPVAAGMATAVIRYSDNQDDIRALREGALDQYTAEKEAYTSYREAQIRNGALGPVPVIEFAESPQDRQTK